MMKHRGSSAETRCLHDLFLDFFHAAGPRLFPFTLFPPKSKVKLLPSSKLLASHSLLLQAKQPPSHLLAYSFCLVVFNLTILFEPHQLFLELVRRF